MEMRFLEFKELTEKRKGGCEMGWAGLGWVGDCDGIVVVLVVTF